VCIYRDSRGIQLRGRAIVRLLLCGWFGSDNWGDELLLSTTARLMQDASPGCEVTAMCARPERVTELHGLDAICFPTVRPVRSLPVRWLSSARAIRASDVVVLGPGTIFQERSHTLRRPGTLPLLMRVIVLSFAVRTPVVIFGAAVREGGSRVGNWALKAAGMLCKDVWVRDDASAAVFGPKARVIGDVATAATVDELAPDRERDDARADIVFSVRPVAERAEAHLAGVVNGVAAEFAASGRGVSFVAMALGRGARRESDLAVHQEYFAKWPVVPVVDIAGATFANMRSEIFAAIGSAHVVVAMRLHAAVIAILLGVPVIAIAYERKVRVTMEQLGQGQWVVDPDVSGDELTRLVKLRLEAPHASRTGVERCTHYAHVVRCAAETITEPRP
jgi:polysaccharide pyruvyl transferase WcaK-like protein